MLLSEYLREITAVIDEIASAGFLLASEVQNDFRTDQIGTVGGKLSFLDGSQLHFTEYLDLRGGIDRIAFSFHYQSEDAALIFRYDNARHRPDPGATNHKHHPEGQVVPAGIPDLASVLEEITGYFLR